MAKRDEAVSEVVPLRRVRRTLEGVPEVSFSDGRAQVRAVEPERVAAVDLSDKQKVWLMLGDGGTGKTTEVRFLVGRMVEQGRGGALLAALDPGLRSLASWFSGVEEPPSSEASQAARWLRELFEALMEEPGPAVLDFGGGGHVALSRVVEASEPGSVHTMLEGRGLGLVACYTLSPRIDDLAVLQHFEAAKFQPEATLLLLNTGKADPTQDAEEAFEAVRRHSAYRRAVDRGAVPVWMPTLEADVMQEIEAKRLSFVMARDGQVPPRASFPPVGGFKRSMVTRWLARMEEAHRPVATWLP
jgi:hypothetical protein